MKAMTVAVMLAVLGLAGSVQAAGAVDTAERITAYQGEYQLANGDTLTLRRRGNQAYAALGNGDWQRIKATGRGSFATLDGKLSIHIELADDSAASGWVAQAGGNRPAPAGAQVASAR
ncbi:MAG: hypothetical protein ACEQSK_18105 [Sphingomonadaceae bacterium]